MSRYRWFRLLPILVMTVVVVAGGPAAAVPLRDAPVFGDVTFSTGFDAETRTVINASTHFASFTVQLHASWSYEGTAPGALTKTVWYLDGEIVSENEGRMSSTDGVLEMNLEAVDGLPLPQGRYLMEFEYEGTVAVTGECFIVGDPGPESRSESKLSPFVFSTEFDEETQQPGPEATEFPYGTQQVFATVTYHDIEPGTPQHWAVFYLAPGTDEFELPYYGHETFESSDGVWSVRMAPDGGEPLPPGRYVVKFGVGSLGDFEGLFVVAPDPAATPQPTSPEGKVSPGFGPISFAMDVTDDGELVDPRTTFPPGTGAVWAYFTYENMRDGMSWGKIWLENGEDFYTDIDAVWDDGSDGWMALRITNEPLPLEGLYSLTLYVEGEPLQSGNFVVEVGLPEDLPTSVPGPQPTVEGTPGAWSGQLDSEPAVTPETIQLPTFGPMHFATEWDEAAGRPSGSIRAVKPGIDSFYVYADWEGAEPGTEVLIFALYQNPLLVDDEMIYLNMETLPDSSGTLWHEIYDLIDEKPLLPGLYTVFVSLEGEDIAGGRIMASPDLEAAEKYYSSRPVPDEEPVSPEPQPTEAPVEPPDKSGVPGLEFGPITFTTEFDAREMRPVGSSSVIEQGLPHFYAYAEFKSTEPGMLFVTSGRYVAPGLGEGKQIYYHTEYLDEAEGLWWEQVQDMEAGELRPGRYEVLVMVDGRTAGKVEVPVGSDVPEVLPEPTPAEPIPTEPVATAEPGETELRVGPVVYSATFDWDTLELGPLATDFPAGTEEVYAQFEYEGLPTGKWQWSTTRVTSPEMGTNAFVCDSSNEYYSESGRWVEEIRMHSGGPLPPGEYRVEFELFTEGPMVPIHEGTFTVGAGEEEVPVSPEPVPTEPVATATPADTGPGADLWAGPMQFSDSYGEGKLGPTATNFPVGTEAVYARIEYEGLKENRMQWMKTTVSSPEMGTGSFVCDDSNQYYSGSGTWSETIRMHDGGTLPAGEYLVQFSLVSDGAMWPVKEGTFTVGGTDEVIPGEGPAFGPVTFCDDVTEDGEPINPAEHFTAGTTEVSALFDYSGMTDGMSWGHLWMRDGEVYVDGTDSVWEEGPEGWTAYYIEEDDGSPLVGEFELKLFIEGVEVQSGWFTVDEVGSDESTVAAFGAIQFAEELLEDDAPFGIGSEFPEGIDRVYGVFPFVGMSDGQDWAFEWLYNGEEIDYQDLAWNEGSSGVSYRFVYNKEQLAPGTYTLNLYIGGQLARSADFDVVGYDEPEGPVLPREPGTPDELIDPRLMPAWEMLRDAGPEILYDLAQFPLRHHIPIRIEERGHNYASYKHSCTEPPEPGALLVSPTYYETHEWEEIAAMMGHELTHAVQHLVSNQCYPSIEKEYYAHTTQLYVLQELDRMDLIEDKWRGTYDDYGRFDGNTLWYVLKDLYPDLPDYSD